MPKVFLMFVLYILPFLVTMSQPQWRNGKKLTCFRTDDPKWRGAPWKRGRKSRKSVEAETVENILKEVKELAKPGRRRKKLRLSNGNRRRHRANFREVLRQIPRIGAASVINQAAKAMEAERDDRQEQLARRLMKGKPTERQKEAMQRYFRLRREMDADAPPRRDSPARAAKPKKRKRRNRRWSRKKSRR